MNKNVGSLDKTIRLIVGILIIVIGVLNERPNGPCCNTRIDIKRVEKAVQDFIITEVDSKI